MCQFAMRSWPFVEFLKIEPDCRVLDRCYLVINNARGQVQHRIQLRRLQASDSRPEPRESVRCIYRIEISKTLSKRSVISRPMRYIRSDQSSQPLARRRLKFS